MSERDSARRRLAEILAGLDVCVDPQFELRVWAFLEDLGRWNETGRLTGYRTESEQVAHLIGESLMLLSVLPASPCPLLDIGTGAGIPGLVLKLARPQWDITLCEANRRRANFLRHVVRRLDLGAVAVHRERAETLATVPAHRMLYRVVTLRAVASPAVAGALAQPFLREDGHMVVPVGPRPGRGFGEVREVTVTPQTGPLPLTRRFLILGAAELRRNVPRGTTRGRGTDLGGGQPEGWGGQDNDSR